VCLLVLGKTWPGLIERVSFSFVFVSKQKRKHESKDLVRVGMNLDCLQMYCWTFPGGRHSDIPVSFLPETSFANSVASLSPCRWPSNEYLWLLNIQEIHECVLGGWRNGTRCIALGIEPFSKGILG